MDPLALAATIDQTLLKPNVGETEGRAWIEKQRDAGFASLCVWPALVPATAELLAGTCTKVCTVVAFPLGYSLTVSKADEARRLVQAGAVEIDMVVNVGEVVARRFDMVGSDIEAVVTATAEESGGAAIVKVIIETGYLTADLITLASVVAVRAGADFVKTSTGFGPRGASVEDVVLMRAAVGPEIGVKASGGIRDLASALAMLGAGASRLGTSGGLEIVAAARASDRAGA